MSNIFRNFFVWNVKFWGNYKEKERGKKKDMKIGGKLGASLL